MAEQFLDYEKALTCIHCGLCLASCPTYLETGNENDSPRGRIYIMRGVQNGRLPLDETAVRHIDLCLGCRACEVACPSGVQYGELLESTRAHIEHRYPRSVFQTFLRRVAIEQVFPYPWRMKLAVLPVKLARALGLGGLLPKVAAFVPEDARAVTLPETSPTTVTPTRGRVGLVAGCVQSAMFGETNAATVRLLNAAGYEVVTPREQVCCGALFAHGGNLARAREFARRNIAVFEQYNLDAIVINAAGCGSTLKEYGHLVGDERARKFGAKVKDLSEILCALPGGGPRSVVAESVRGRRDGARPSAENARVTFHDACHLAHAQRITKPPRELVRAVAGENFVELPEAEVCCGSAGSYNLTEPEMAERLQKRKIENILKTGAQVVVTSNPGCILQIRAGLRKAGAVNVRVLHLADYLAEAMLGRNDG